MGRDRDRASKNGVRRGTPESTESLDHELEMQQRREGGLKDDVKVLRMNIRRQNMSNGKMIVFGLPEYELVTGWPDERTTHKSRNGICGGTRIRVERKKYK